MIPHRTIMAAAKPGYRDLVLADEPYAYYRLEHTAGVIAADETSARRDATCRGDVQLGEPGLVSGSAAAVRFGGAAACLDVPFALDSADSSVTCELWILTPATPPSTGQQTLLAQRDGTAVGHRWLYIDDGNHDGLGAGSLNTGLSGSPSATGTVITTATRYHLALVLTAQTWQLYVNGEASGRGELSPQAGTGAFVLGTDKSLSENPFQGVVDEIAFYTDALGGARVKAHYEAGA